MNIAMAYAVIRTQICLQPTDDVVVDTRGMPPAVLAQVTDAVCVHSGLAGTAVALYENGACRELDVVNAAFTHSQL